ncbi:MAG: PKD domain-containing protein [Bacteroidota bacterium]
MQKRKAYILTLFSFWTFCLAAQCPQFFNGQGIASSNPYWIGCSGGNYTIFVQSTIAITGGYVIDWGDGTANTAGASLIPPAFISHTYIAAVDTFRITITTTSPACSISGVVVMELTPSASIQIPLGSAVYGCTPASFNFQNASTNISETTRFTWTFGDGTPVQNYDYSNAGVVLNHTYLPGTSNCNVAVTLTAENYCNRGNPSTNTYQPIQVWDRDDVNITADALIKCAPSNTFHFDNTTNLNCSALGNNQQRYEYWNFGDYWGLGHDSIISWQPFNPPNRAGYDLVYPGIGSYTVLLMDSSFCGVDQEIITVQIIAPPIADLSLNADSICEGQSVIATNLSSTNANQFIWDFGDGTPIVIVTNAAAQTHLYSNAATYTVSLIANISGASGCTSSATEQVVVKPSPIADFNLGANNFCDTGTETFVNASSGTIGTYSWNFGNGNTSALPNPLPQLYTGMGTYTVQLNVTGANGCGANTSKQVIVYQSPNAQINPFSVCKAASGVFSDASTSVTGDPINSWSWNFGDLSAISNSQNPSHTFADSGVYNVTLTVTTAFCSNKDSISATVNPLPLANFQQSADSGCTALIVSFTNQSTGASSYTWNFGDGTAASSAVNPNHTFTNLQPVDITYHVSLIAVSALGCRDTVIADVTVFHAAHASFTSDYLINCSPLPVQFTNTSAGAVNYSWNFGDGSAISTAADPNHLYVNNTSFLQTYITTLSVTSPNGCTNSTSQNIMVYPSPNFSFLALPTDTGCAPLSINFNASSGGAVYQWNFGDGSTSLIQSPAHTFINNGLIDILYNVVLITTSPFSCKDTTDLNVLVHPNPIAGFTQSGSLGCSPLDVSFTNNSTIANTSSWNFGDGTFSTAVNPIHTFVNNTSSTVIYNVILQVETAYGCIDTMIRPVEVFPKVTAAFVSPTNACSPLNITMVNNSTNAITYNWDFGDGGLSSQTNPSHNYNNPTASDINYTIKLVAQSSVGCTDTTSVPITVFYKPNAGFNVSSNAGCPPLSVAFNDLTVGVTNSSWTFGDGSAASGANQNHTYLNSTANSVINSAQLIVTTTNSCRDTMIVPITVYPEVIASFSGQANGCSPLNITFTNQSAHADFYNWDLGDGTLSNQANLLHTYINNTSADTNYTILLNASSSFGCVDTQTVLINVKYKPNVFFNQSANAGCSPLLVNFLDQSVNVISHQWDFGDGSAFDNLQNTSHMYANTTSSTITNNIIYIGTASNGCADTANNAILIYPKVTAAFTRPPIGCSPFTADFINQSLNSTTYLWDFGDGNFSAQNNPSNIFTTSSTANQVYTVQLISFSSFGCADTVNNTITVAPQPVANFSASPLSQTYPSAEVSVINTTNTGSWNYSWSWGNSNTSSLQQPASNIYSTWGNYTITLIVNSAVCADTVSKSVIILPPLPIAAFNMPAYDGCEPEQICFTNNSQYNVSNTWEFGDGNISNAPNPCYTYFSAGTFNVRLTTTGPGGQTDMFDTIVNIYPRPQANFSATPTLVQIPNTQAQFLNLSIDGDSCFWNFGDGATSSAQNPQHAYTSVGHYDVTLIASNQYGCVDSITKANYITAEQINDIVIPNAFSPNPSGSNGGAYDITNYNNDVFFPFTVNGIDEYKLTIFNKWGEVVFESSDIHIGWDGHYKGRICQPDVYVWKAQGKYLDGTTYLKLGDVTLLK